MSKEVRISQQTADTLYALICNAIEEEQNFPEHDGDEWMNQMLEAKKAFAKADRIVIGD